MVISGARPVALRRVNYYEDYQFIDLFEPHPDYPFSAPKTLTVGTGEMGVSLEEFGLRIGAWSIKPLQIAAGGAEAAAVVIAGGAADGTKVASIRIPRVGLIEAVPGSAEEVPAGPLFSLRYYEDGAALVDPFAQLREACNFYTDSLAREQRQLAAKKQSTRRAVRVLAVLAGVLVLAWRIAVIQKQDRKLRKPRRLRLLNEAPTKPPKKPPTRLVYWPGRRSSPRRRSRAGSDNSGTNPGYRARRERAARSGGHVGDAR